MGTISTGKCPKCDAVVSSVEADAININFNFQSSWKGVAYHCTSCYAVLGVQIDPLALKADTVAEIVHALKRS